MANITFRYVGIDPKTLPYSLQQAVIILTVSYSYSFLIIKMYVSFLRVLVTRARVQPMGYYLLLSLKYSGSNVQLKSPQTVTQRNTYVHP